MCPLLQMAKFGTGKCCGARKNRNAMIWCWVEARWLPNLARIVREQQKMPWEAVIDLLVKYSGYERYGLKAKYYPNRIKQWLRYIAMQYSQAETLYREVRVLQQSSDIVQVLYRYRTVYSWQRRNCILMLIVNANHADRCFAFAFDVFLLVVHRLPFAFILWRRVLFSGVKRQIVFELQRNDNQKNRQQWKKTENLTPILASIGWRCRWNTRC